MRKKVYGRLLGRAVGSRKALFRSLVREMVLHGTITTTKAKAKAVQPNLDKVMNLVAKGDLASRRKLDAMTAQDQEVVKKLFKNYQSFAGSRKSGFTRIIQLPPRRGDSAEVAKLQWSEEVDLKAPEDSPKVKEAKKETKTRSKKLLEKIKK